MSYHTSVLLKEAIDNLQVSKGIYVDATMGGGGHSLEMYKRLKEGMLISIDQDEDAINHVNEIKPKDTSDKKWIVQKGNFKDLKMILKDLKIDEIDGILYDIGVSSYQLDTKERGFSYNKSSPLDMRMDKNNELTAEEILNSYKKEDLNRIFKEYGEEPHAKRITNKILEYRKEKKISNSRELMNIIHSCFGGMSSERVAKRVFQALRVEVNKELSALSLSLTQAFESLKSNGTCAVITFQPLERKVVDIFTQENSNVNVDQIIEPGAIELVNNIRSKSAKLYILKKA